MIELFNIVASVFGYIILGYLVNKLKLLPKKYINYFDFKHWLTNESNYD